MYGKIAGILFPVFAVGLIGAGMWGYQENQEKNSILIKAENQYQGAFHNLNYHVDKLHDELGKALAVNSRRQLAPCLTNVWRLAYSAQNNVSQLPLTLMPFNETNKFLANVADFSYQSGMRDLDKQPLTEKERKTLQALYNHSKEIRGSLQKVQSAVITKQLRWMDVESAIATEEKQQDNTIVDGLTVINRDVQGYKDVDFGAGIGSLNQSHKMKAQSLKGSPVTQEEARKRALQFAGTKQAKQVVVNANGKGTDLETYSVRITERNGSNPINVDVAKRGGGIVWLLNERNVGSAKMNLEAARQRADTYLKTHGYSSMEPASVSEYEGSAAFTYVYREKDVRVYPDSVTVTVAMDNGEVTGFQSEGYLLNHKQRSIPKPKLTQQQARTRVSKSFQVLETRRAIIEDDRGSEAHVYEFYGTMGKDRYRLFIDAMTGEEIKVEKIKATAI
ncbi:germination protein YpeB [Aneurinibacillus tyrosinisolvens]|uniref:germination protein YpeB n=1 Tax=Aneurinibacillus tyrosinisolvens TaxID=1443435 RepID=UPI00063F71CC|nr:germination protein YpeB [Aneurinibacillus tyrosinisolvens]